VTIKAFRKGRNSKCKPAPICMENSWENGKIPNVGRWNSRRSCCLRTVIYESTYWIFFSPQHLIYICRTKVVHRIGTRTARSSSVIEKRSCCGCCGARPDCPAKKDRVMIVTDRSSFRPFRKPNARIACSHYEQHGCRENRHHHVNVDNAQFGQHVQAKENGGPLLDGNILGRREPQTPRGQYVDERPQHQREMVISNAMASPPLR
jgi:hypothetical protein